MWKTKPIRTFAACLFLAGIANFFPRPLRPASLNHLPEQNVQANELQVSDAEIQRLIRELGDDQFKVRQSAAKRLTEIGKPALKALAEAEENTKDLETRLRAKLLTKSIREANRLPTRVDGLEFALLPDTHWDFPKPGENKPLAIYLQITNLRHKNICFSMKQAVALILRDAEGKKVPGGYWGTQASLGVSPLSKPLDHGDALEIRLSCQLAYFEGKCCLIYDDSQGDSWVYRGVTQGDYRLSVVYEITEQPQHPLAKELFWIGRAETVSESIVIE